MKLNFNLQHFSFFCLGALTIMLTDVYVFSDFTASVITATTASITLLIALKTASKVNKWLDEKIKDKKFEKAHHFFEDLHRLTVSVTLLEALLQRIASKPLNLQDEDLVNALTEANEKLQTSKNLLLELSIHEYHLIGLKIKLRNNKAYEKYYSYAAKILKHAHYCLQSYKALIATKDKHNFNNVHYIYHKQSEIIKSKKEIKIIHDTFQYISKGLAKVEFSKMYDLKGD